MTGAYQSMTVTSADPRAAGVGAPPGRPGRAVAFQATATHIQWQLVGDATWRDLLPLTAIFGPPPQLRVTDDEIQWRGDPAKGWLDLVPLSTLKGVDGREIALRVQNALIEWRLGTAGGWNELLALSALMGPMPTISIADVVTSAPGAPATVTATPKTDGKGYDLSFAIPRGVNGQSAYEVWLGAGNIGSTADFFAALAAQAGQNTLVDQQLRLNALNIAELRGDRMNMIDGIVDPYNDLTDIVTGASSNYSHTAGILRPVASALTGTPMSGGDRSATFLKANAFDGDTQTRWAPAQDGASTTDAAYIGLDLGSAKEVGRVAINHPNPTNNIPAVLAIQWSDNSAAWTTVATLNSAIQGVTVAVFANAGAHRYWRILAKAPLASNEVWVISELVFSTPLKPMEIRSAAFPSDVASPSQARLAVQVAPAIDSAGVVVNADLVSSVSRDGGTTWSVASLVAVETLADGTILFEGAVNMAGQPAGQSMAYRHATANGKDVRVSGTILQWRT